MSDFYGIRPGTIPGFAEADGGRFMSVTDLPGHTVRNMAMFMDKLRGMHEDDPLAFEVCLRHVASIIEDQRRVPLQNAVRMSGLRFQGVVHEAR